MGRASSKRKFSMKVGRPELVVIDGVEYYRGGKSTFSRREKRLAAKALFRSISPQRLYRLVFYGAVSTLEEKKLFTDVVAAQGVAPTDEYVESVLFCAFELLRDEVGLMFSSTQDAEKYADEFLDFFGRKAFSQHSGMLSSFSDEERDMVMLFLIDHGYRLHVANFAMLCRAAWGNS